MKFRLPRNGKEVTSVDTLLGCYITGDGRVIGILSRCSEIFQLINAWLECLMSNVSPNSPDTVCTMYMYMDFSVENMIF
jgi:hypothetical protein